MEYQNLCSQLKVNKEQLITLKTQEKELQSELKESVKQINKISKDELLANDELYKALLQDKEDFEALILKLKFRIKPWDEEAFALTDDSIKLFYPSSIYEPLKAINNAMQDKITELENKAKEIADNSECLDLQQKLVDIQKEIYNTNERIQDIESGILCCNGLMNECRMKDLGELIRSNLINDRYPLIIEFADQDQIVISTRYLTVGTLNDHHEIDYDAGHGIDSIIDKFYEQVVKIEEEESVEITVKEENIYVSYGEHPGDEACESFTLHIKIKKKG